MLLALGFSTVHALGGGVWSSGCGFELTDQLFDAALGEFSVVASEQPSMIVGDLNVEPTKTPSCLTASRLVSGLICKRCWCGRRVGLQENVGLPEIVGISRLDAHSARLQRGCEVMTDRWVQPHLAVRSWVHVNRRSASITQRAQVTPL